MMQLTPAMHPAGQHGVNNAFHLAQKSAAAGAEDRGGAGRSAN
jgi:hypothetical protein